MNLDMSIVVPGVACVVALMIVLKVFKGIIRFTLLCAILVASVKICGVI